MLTGGGAGAPLMLVPMINSAAGGPLLPTGTKVVLRGLAKRSELNGCPGEV